MKRMNEKLKNSRGASMVFALLVFLLCVLAGTAVLTAASANVGRYTHLEDEQRQYFSVASALEILQGKLNEREIKVEVQCVETETWYYEHETPGDPSSKLVLKKEVSNEYNISKAGSLSPTYFQYQLLDKYLPSEWWNKIKSDVSALVSSPLWSDKTYTIKLDETIDEEWLDKIYPVTAIVKHGTDDGIFNLIIYLTTEKGDAYPLKVEWPGEVKTETKTEVTTTGDPGIDTGTRTTTTTVTITLTWSEEDRQITFEKGS